MEEKQNYKNKLGLLGWLSGGRYGLERYAYILHRISGLALLLYFVMHIFVTAARVNGAKSWEDTMGFFKSPAFLVGEFLVFCAFAYHALSGIRLLFGEFGVFLGKPKRPDYPYKPSTLRQRPVLLLIMALVAILVIAGGVDFFLFH